MVSRNIATARALRRNLTDAERKLWFKLRDRRLAGMKFRRQMPVGRYIADFACEQSRLIVEIDGGQHADRAGRDAERTFEIEAMGYLVLRFWNNDVLQNMDGVLDRIAASAQQRASVTPSP